jgi:hypothetical protein
MDFFERQWSSYRAIVEHNLMEHRSVAACTAAVLEGWLSKRPTTAPAPSMIDLGCGDLALLAPLLRRLPLNDYTGLDLAAVVLPLAQQALGDVPYPTRWQEGDLLQWALDDAAPERDDASATPHMQAHTQPDILHSAFAIHHLSNDQKLIILEGARRRINSGGIFIWVDVFRKPGESLPNYANRYAARVHNDWQALDPVQRSHVVTHLRQFDIPADQELIEVAAVAAGWKWEWAWRGQHQAEALAVLTPA